MVWLHGGGFTNGSCMEGSAYDGKNLSEFGDVVVVSINLASTSSVLSIFPPTALSMRSRATRG